MALWQLMHLGTSWALKNRTPCAQLHMNYAHLASVRFEHAVCIYIYIFKKKIITIESYSYSTCGMFDLQFIGLILTKAVEG